MIRNSNQLRLTIGTASNTVQLYNNLATLFAIEISSQGVKVSWKTATTSSTSFSLTSPIGIPSSGIIYYQSSDYSSGMQAANVILENFSLSANPIATWNNCAPGRDACIELQSICCVANGDILTGKTTCRPPGYCS